MEVLRNPKRRFLQKPQGITSQKMTYIWEAKVYAYYFIMFT
jgi:hypothetical protein